ncbi:TPA: DUF4145 domain-containing protein [Vibrio vulnificus]|uniref:DUF4145 domain-containing protein n=2 Tax=Vibrio vulnificus TaxID=672 RepID=A0ABX4WWC3_VIBVL|nr:DUF4145 domain-containing protein [Vibrio vulnificus]POB93876.1 DUF4145 domain-containing protein [Vibrio vulnificus]HAS6957204.1 DUF4145 domain-containing protein [Vibrio vulnificus]HAS8295497.1 DUF4145 domain-containing protein [Vibrio vulnificus]HAS8465900.1 DUF4145 domain-containing protein [Vibrio vulnificus]
MLVTMTKNLIASSHVGQILRCPCSSCETESKHTVVADVELQLREEDSHNFYGSDKQYQTIQCNGCDTISFRIAHYSTEDIYHIEGEENGFNDIYLQAEEFYPNPNVSREPIDNLGWLPSHIPPIYSETLLALNNNQRILAGIGIRAILESVCKNLGATGGTLHRKIDSLVETKSLSLNDAEVLKLIKNMGNNAAHDVLLHEHDQLEIAFNIIERMLESVYIAPKLLKATLQNQN